MDDSLHVRLFRVSTAPAANSFAVVDINLDAAESSVHTVHASAQRYWIMCNLNLTTTTFQAAVLISELSYNKPHDRKYSWMQSWKKFMQFSVSHWRWWWSLLTLGQMKRSCCIFETTAAWKVPPFVPSEIFCNSRCTTVVYKADIYRVHKCNFLTSYPMRHCLKTTLFQQICNST